MFRLSNVLIIEILRSAVMSECRESNAETRVELKSPFNERENMLLFSNKILRSLISLVICIDYLNFPAKVPFCLLSPVSRQLFLAIFTGEISQYLRFSNG